MSEISIHNDSSKFFKGSIWWWTRSAKCSNNKYYDLMFDKDTMVIVLSENYNETVTVVPVYPPCSTFDTVDINYDPYLVFAHVNNKDCYVYCNNINTVPTKTLKSFVGMMSSSKMSEIEDMVSKYFQLSATYEEVSENRDEVVDIPEKDKNPSSSFVKKKAKRGRKACPVYCDKTDTVYDSVLSASNILCISKNAIYKSINKGVPVKGMQFISENSDTCTTL